VTCFMASDGIVSPLGCIGHWNRRPWPTGGQRFCRPCGFATRCVAKEDEGGRPAAAPPGVSMIGGHAPHLEVYPPMGSNPSTGLHSSAPVGHNLTIPALKTRSANDSSCDSSSDSSSDSSCDSSRESSPNSTFDPTIDSTLMASKREREGTGTGTPHLPAAGPGRAGGGRPGIPL
jgi:hypothetical protein